MATFFVGKSFGSITKIFLHEEDAQFWFDSVNSLYNKGEACYFLALHMHKIGMICIDTHRPDWLKSSPLFCRVLHVLTHSQADWLATFKHFDKPKQRGRQQLMPSARFWRKTSAWNPRQGMPTRESPRMVRTFSARSSRNRREQRFLSAKFVSLGQPLTSCKILRSRATLRECCWGAGTQPYPGALQLALSFRMVSTRTALTLSWWKQAWQS